MIYITGDCHGDMKRFTSKNFPEQKEMTKDDYVIILGDFGLIWDYKCESEYEKHELDLLNNRPFTTLFIDGNHENFDRLYKYPVEEWHGGKIHKIRDSVYHLMRGEMFDIDGLKCFAFGGASSHDISGGLYEPDDTEGIKKAKHDPYLRPFRIIGRSWWKEELPSKEEMQHGYETLEKNDWKCDFIFTHDAPTSTKALLGYKEFDDLNRYFEDIHAKSYYKKWFFGHLHEDKAINTKDILFYEQIVQIH